MFKQHLKDETVFIKTLLLSIVSLFIFTMVSSSVSAQAMASPSASTTKTKTKTSSVHTREHPIAIYVSGNYLYLLNDKSHTLEIFDISKPSSPKWMSSISTYANPESLTVLGNRAYVGLLGSSTSKSPMGIIQVFNVANPAKPVDLNGDGYQTVTDVPHSIQAVDVNGPTFLVGANYDSYYDVSAFSVYNASNPKNVATVFGQSLDGGGPVDLYVNGSYAFETESSFLAIWDISAIFTPTFVNDPSSGPDVDRGTPVADDLTAVTATDKYAFVLSGLQKLYIFDYAKKPSKPTLVNGKNGTSTAISSQDGLPVAIKVADNKYAYVICRSINRIETFDVSNPASPKLLSKVATQNAPDALALSDNGSYLYVTNYLSNTLQTFSLANPAKPSN